MLHDVGFRPHGCRMAELGPGDTVGLGLAALLSGVSHYTGLDVVPFSRNFQPVPFFDELCGLAKNSTTFQSVSESEIGCLRSALEPGLNENELIRYEVPWNVNSVSGNSLDLVLSIVMLQHIDGLDDVFETMYEWLRPGGFACHIIPLTASFLSPYWNGHWAYSDLEWRLVRGGRPFLTNREPASMYVKTAEAAGFEVLTAQKVPGSDGLPKAALAPRFRNMEAVDLTTRQLRLVIRKPVGHGP